MHWQTARHGNLLLMIGAVVAIPLLIVAYNFMFPWAYTSAWDKEYTTGHVGFPGDRILIKLNESTLEGKHKIHGINVQISGDPIWGINIKVSGGDEQEDKIRYKDSNPSNRYGVGNIYITVPKQPNLYERSLELRYSAEFDFPVQTGPDSFRWSSKPVSGSRTLVIGTKDQQKTLQLANSILLALEILVGLILVWSLSNFLKADPQLPPNTRVTFVFATAVIIAAVFGSALIQYFAD